MCDFCSKHGDGEIWYKNTRNYARDLLSDINRRQYVKDFLQSTIGEGITSLGRLEAIYKKKQRLPDRLVTAMIDKAREEHFGQVVPIEDIRTIVNGAASIVRLPCACRWAAEKKENRCCYSVTYSAEKWYADLDMKYFGLPPDDGFETLSSTEAIAQMEILGQQGSVHTIWTMVTPFIGAICNCTGNECLGLRTLAMNVETMSRGEYVAVVDTSSCIGCGHCVDACHFKAISGEKAGDGDIVAAINSEKCYGCGLCRNHCVHNAISLVAR